MRTSRRIQRLTRVRPKLQAINLTSLMDVFTILVFFLLVNSGSSEILQAPKQMVLPESEVEAKPRETVVVYVSPDEVLVQGEPVARIDDIIAAEGELIDAIVARLAELEERVIGVRTQVVAESKEVTILADKSIPFEVVKRVMTSCTSQGYERISLAVIQKDSGATQI